MTRECHVRFCERLRGKFPRPTHHFGLKAHIGVDSKRGVVHSVCTSAASVADKHMLPDLLHGEERDGRQLELPGGKSS
jgi:IS5 family transposase